MHYLFYCAISLGCLLCTVFQNPHIYVNDEGLKFYVRCICIRLFLLYKMMREGRVYLCETFLLLKVYIPTCEIFTTSRKPRVEKTNKILVEFSAWCIWLRGLFNNNTFFERTEPCLKGAFFSQLFCIMWLELNDFGIFFGIRFVLNILNESIVVFIVHCTN